MADILPTPGAGPSTWMQTDIRELDLRPQACRTCREAWPFAVFKRNLDLTRNLSEPQECTRCLGTEELRWKTAVIPMMKAQIEAAHAAYIAQTQKKLPARAAPSTVAPAAASASALAPVFSIVPSPKKTVYVQESGFQIRAKPTASLRASTSFINGVSGSSHDQPQPVQIPSLAGPSRIGVGNRNVTYQDGEAWMVERYTGTGSQVKIISGLEPIAEPIRAGLWLHTFYQPSSDNRQDLTQRALYEHYRTTFHHSLRVRRLDGRNLMRLISRAFGFAKVQLSKEGYTIKGLSRKMVPGLAQGDALVTLKQYLEQQLSQDLIPSDYPPPQSHQQNLYQHPPQAIAAPAGPYVHYPPAGPPVYSEAQQHQQPYGYDYQYQQQSHYPNVPGQNGGGSGAFAHAPQYQPPPAQYTTQYGAQPPPPPLASATSGNMGMSVLHKSKRGGKGGSIPVDVIDLSLDE